MAVVPNWLQVCFVYKIIVSVIQRVESISDMMPYIYWGEGELVSYHFFEYSCSNIR
jgi:hypothetical protein